MIFPGQSEEMLRKSEKTSSSIAKSVLLPEHHFHNIHYQDKSIATLAKAINGDSCNNFCCYPIKLLFTQPMAHKKDSKFNEA